MNAYATTKKQAEVRLRIAGLELKNKVFTAPMAGITGRAFREILKQQGTSLAFGEMISAQALIYNNPRTYELLCLEGEEHPVAVQLFGSSPQMIAEAALIVQSLGADLIDINMGCPTPKIIRNGEGCALMLKPELAATIVAQTVKTVNVPLTVKMRTGWDAENLNCVDLAQRLEAAGAAAITIHGRNCRQLYNGKADWRMIANVKKALSIPVIGNGDISNPRDAALMLDITDCDAVMVGRGMLGNPWLIADIVAYLQGEEAKGRPPTPQVFAQALAHLRREVELAISLQKNEKKDAELIAREAESFAVRAMRNHLGWYIKAIPQAAAMRNKINHRNTVKEIEELFTDWLEEHNL